MSLDFKRDNILLESFTAKIKRFNLSPKQMFEIEKFLNQSLNASYKEGFEDGLKFILNRINHT